MNRITYILLAITIVMSLPSCKTYNMFEPSKKDKRQSDTLDQIFYYNPSYQHLVDVDNKVNISVWGQEELSIGSVYGIYNSNEVYGKWLLVDANGNIEVPKIGTMMVKGMTVPQIKDSIKTLISEWVVNPVVDVKIMNKEITLLGEFRDPAVIKVDKDHNTLLDMIARVGGFDFYANLKNIKVLRQDGPHVKIANIDLTKSGDIRLQNLELRPGDVVIAPSKKNKEFDKRVSTIIPFASTATAAAILIGLL